MTSRVKISYRQHIPLQCLDPFNLSSLGDGEERDQKLPKRLSKKVLKIRSKILEKEQLIIWNCPGQERMARRACRRLWQEETGSNSWANEPVLLRTFLCPVVCLVSAQEFILKCLELYVRAGLLVTHTVLVAPAIFK